MAKMLNRVNGDINMLICIVEEILDRADTSGAEGRTEAILDILEYF